jgi:hypothetical protein
MGLFTNLWLLANPVVVHGMGESDENVVFYWNPAVANQIS